MNYFIRIFVFSSVLLSLLAAPSIRGQDVESPAKDSKSVENADDNKSYKFTIQASVETTDVKSQGNTGTCWCFASTSFIESELIREGKENLDLSEMFIVKNVYLDKAHNYLRRQGKTNFGQGALAHDFIRAASKHGLVPEFGLRWT